MSEIEDAQPLNLTIGPDDLIWIYGFPTVGKTTFSRTLRFLSQSQRSALGLKDVIDATDTDDWLGVFKISQNPEQIEEIEKLCYDSITLIKKLRSHHPRVITTNLWRSMAKAGVKPSLICLPVSAESVGSRVARRGDSHPEWITDHADQWMREITESEWFHQNLEVVRYVDEEDYLADCILINGRELSYRFDKEKAVVSSPSKARFNPVKAGSVADSQGAPVHEDDEGKDVKSLLNSESECVDGDRQPDIQFGKAIPDRFFSDGWKPQDRSKFVVKQWTVLDSYNQFAIFVVSTGMLTSSQLGMCWDIGPWAKAIEINVETVDVIDPAMIHGVIAHEVNHAVTCIMQAICAQERSQEPEAYLTQQLVDLVNAVYKGDKHD